MAKPYGPLFMLFCSQNCKQNRSVCVFIVCHFFCRHCRDVSSYVCHGSTISSADFLRKLSHAHKSWPNYRSSDSCFRAVYNRVQNWYLWRLYLYASITLPIRFLRSPDRRDRRLTGSMTVLTVRRTGFFPSEQKFRTVRLTVETVGGDRTRPYALTVSGRSYGL